MSFKFVAGILLAGWFGIGVSPSCADVYRYENPSTGHIEYSDAPTYPGFRLIIETPEPFSHPDSLVFGKRPRLSKAQRSSRVPLVKAGGVYEVPTVLNGTTIAVMILDSGASEVTITLGTALALIENGTIDHTDLLPEGVYRLANGELSKAKRFNLRSLSIGNRTLKNVVCNVAESLDAPMLIGQSALERLGKYSVDYKKRVLNLE